jgi:hypothetical protein
LWSWQAADNKEEQHEVIRQIKAVRARMEATEASAVLGPRMTRDQRRRKLEQERGGTKPSSPKVSGGAATGAGAGAGVGAGVVVGVGTCAGAEEEVEQPRSEWCRRFGFKGAPLPPNALCQEACKVYVAWLPELARDWHDKPHAALWCVCASDWVEHACRQSNVCSL